MNYRTMGIELELKHLLIDSGYVIYKVIKNISGQTGFDFYVMKENCPLNVTFMVSKICGLPLATHTEIIKEKDDIVQTISIKLFNDSERIRELVL